MIHKISDKLSYFTVSRTSLIIDHFVEIKHRILIYDMNENEFKNIDKFIYNNEFHKLIESAKLYILDHDFAIYGDVKGLILNLKNKNLVLYSDIDEIVNKNYGYGITFTTYNLKINEFINRLNNNVINSNEFIKMMK